MTNSAQDAMVPRRRWWQVSLSSFFVLTAVVSLPLAWRAMQTHEDRQRLLAGGYPTLIDTDSELNDRKVFAMLNEDTAMEFVETPLVDVAAYLSDLHGISVEVDQRALESAKLSITLGVSAHIKGVSLRSGLRHLLRRENLTFVVRDGGLLITTPEAAASHPFVRVYNVAHLVRDEPQAGQLAERLATLFSQRPGSAQIVAYRKLLIVDASFSIHDDLVESLDMVQTGLQYETPPPLSSLNQRRK